MIIAQTTPTTTPIITPVFDVVDESVGNVDESFCYVLDEITPIPLNIEPDDNAVLKFVNVFSNAPDDVADIVPCTRIEPLSILVI